MDTNAAFNQIIDAIGPFLALGAVIVFVVLALEWFFLPFAIFGIKTRLDAIRRTSEKTNVLLESLLKEALIAHSASIADAACVVGSNGVR